MQVQRFPKATSETGSKLLPNILRENVCRTFWETQPAFTMLMKHRSSCVLKPERFWHQKVCIRSAHTKLFRRLQSQVNIFRLGSQNVYEINRGQEKEAITVLGTFSAAGDFLTPFIVLPYKRIPNDVREAIPDSFAIDKTDSGWMQTETFYNYVKNVFHPELKRKEVAFPVVLFVDGHKSHVSLNLAELCRELQIELICLYPNATRIQQPADVSCFKPIKNGWKDGVCCYHLETHEC